MSLQIHRRGNRWVGRYNGVHAWGRSFAECGVKLAGKCPDLAWHLAEIIEAKDDAKRAEECLPPVREMN